MNEEERRQYFLVRAFVQILGGALIGALIWALVPDSGALHLLPAGIGCVVSIPMVAASYGLINGTTADPRVNEQAPNEGQPIRF